MARVKWKTPPSLVRGSAPLGLRGSCVLLTFRSPPPQVHYILQEVVMGGMVLETNMNEIVAQVELQNRMEKSEVRG